MLEPSLPYDKLGIFTGCFHPSGPRGEEDVLTVIYSSVAHLPIHWTLPYTRNCAGLAMAHSKDAGRTWQKCPSNPILKGEPDGLTVTGFRDPYLSEWKAMDALRGEQRKLLYGVVSGGVLNQGPAAFLYAAEPTDISKWEYLGPLVDIPLGSQRPSHWGGDFGVNWECVNFMSLGDASHDFEVIIFGSEGGLRPPSVAGGEAEIGGWTLWAAGSLKATDAGAQLVHNAHGILDNGNFYAPNSYQHPSGVRIVWGWIKEEELTLTRRESKGWTGYLSLPRELFMFRLSNVVRALRTPLEDILSVTLSGVQAEQKAGSGLRTLYTLGIRPLANIRLLRPPHPKTWSNIESLGPHSLTTTKSSNWELEATCSIKFRKGAGRIGIHVRHNTDLSQTTSIYFSPNDESVVVDRSLSNNESDIRKDTQSGPFTLFTTEEDGMETIETLNLRIFCDGDVLEIFANDRFALSTVVFSDEKSCVGISCFVEGANLLGSKFEMISLWEGLAGGVGGVSRDR